jgi:hypothetical protein
VAVATKSEITKLRAAGHNTSDKAECEFMLCVAKATTFIACAETARWSVDKNREIIMRI